MNNKRAKKIRKLVREISGADSQTSYEIKQHKRVKAIPTGQLNLNGTPIMIDREVLCNQLMLSSGCQRYHYKIIKNGYKAL